MADLTSTQSTSMPAWAQPYAEGYLQRAQSVADMPYQAYGGQRVADFTNWQNQALQGIAQRATQGSPVMSGASQGLLDMMGGSSPGATANPYGTVSAQGGGAQVSAGTNAYAGGNPYLGQAIEAAQQDTLRGYNLSVAPQLDRLAAQSGSFGNSGVQQMQLEAGRQLAQQLGNVSSGMRMQDYTQQQQLAENALNRGLQAQQFNAGLGEAAANRNLQAQTTNAGLGEQWAGRNDSAYNNNQARVLQALGLAPSYAQQDYNDLTALQTAGQAYQGLNQKQLDSAYQQFVDSRDYNKQQLDVLGNALGRSYGQTTTSTTPGASTASSVLGGGLTAAAIYNMLFG